MDEKIKNFLGEVNVKSGGRLAEKYRPEFLFIGGGPGSEGCIVVRPPCRTEKEWREKFERL